MNVCLSQRAQRVCLLLCSFYLLLDTGSAAFAFSSTEADRLADSFVSSFFTVSGSNGYLKETQTGGITYFWGQAEMIECVIDAYEWTANPVYGAMITNLLNGFIQHNGSSWLWNIYNDDIMWAVLAFARGGQLTGRPNYCDIAKANFDACYARAWDAKLGGGLYWTTDNNTKNACVNGPGSIAASVLYQIYGDIAYRDKALNMYNWERSVLFNPATGAISDAIGTNGVINTWASTYNQGTFIGAANYLGQTNDAALAAHYTMTRLTSGGILPEYGIAGNNSGFNAIFLRWMTRFKRQRNLESAYQPWLQLNATAAWNVRRASDSLSWCQWAHPSPERTNFYAWDCISSFEAIMAAEPTQPASALPVPPDHRGYWPLDETSGLVAGDASGLGSDGTVNGASWNPEGRVDGCLLFNGVNSSVRISNTLGSDFSITFWVKTSQPSGIGQWYNGKGLVDGDVSLTRNDFGTALLGGKFAFGIGNPDMTVMSGTSIQDGFWHHCVATRQRATGVLNVYVDGQLDGTGVGHKNTLNAPAQLVFGAIASGGGYFNGRLDDVRLFARALSSNEVAALYYSSLIPPASPPPVLSAKPGNGRVELSWGEALAATSYNVKRSLFSGGPFLTLANIPSTSFVVSNLPNNRTYYYAVSAVNRVGESADSPELGATPSTLVTWLKADALHGVPDGATLSSWPDSTGRGCDAIQPLHARRPTLVTNAINGRPAVRFNSAQNTCLWLYRPIQDDFTMVLVFQSNQGLGTGTQFYEGAGLVSSEVPGVVGDFGLSLNANGQVLAGTGNPDTTIRSGAGFNDGRPHVATFKRTRNTGLLVLYVDGIQVAAAAAGTLSLTAPNLLVLGAQQVFNNYFSGDIAELQVHNAALPDTDRLACERALRCKYGLAGGMIPAVPTGLTGLAGDRRISLNWTHSPGTTGYNILRSTNAGLSFEIVASNLPAPGYLDTTAANGRMNYYRIAAVNDCGTGSFSAPLGMFLPLPELQMLSGSNALTITWPDWANNWTLNGATNLTPPVIWIPLPGVPISNNGRLEITLPIGPGNRLFRLISP